MSRVLPRGLICDRGYLFIRLFPGKGHKPHLEGCQQHTPHNEKLAIIKLNDYRKEIFLGRFNSQTSGKAGNYQPFYMTFYHVALRRWLGRPYY